MKRNVYKVLSLLFLCCTLFSFSACANQTPVSKTGLHFDTVITITLYGTNKESLLENCFQLANTYEKLLSRTLEGSDIYRINHASGMPVEVSAETIALLHRAIDYAVLTDGVIDPTVAPLSSLWSFTDHPTPPEESDIREALLHVGYDKISIQGNTVTLTDPLASIDLGFIAKGYIADKIKEYLVSEGITTGLINLGGNLLSIGSRPDGTPFQIGIQYPFQDAGVPITTVSIQDKTVVSSGVYERFFEYDGTLYHHILDTATGYPVSNQLLGVTIIGNSSMEADALSTTCFVLGLEEGLKCINSLPDTDAVFITEDYEVISTLN